ncbi:oligo-1,6-glucosidase [Paenibacillus phyllosphaerae]|uniref:oligo-1,6-glucosidase n=1 Tax=Paenibacillus phyllosphaerae TaxID=274593 RepID=A0A7W5FP09_9BACL|nr:alpha-glucosidase [Paenibacillus phyllosphaerae]MBB3111881.1 oligo-1,6-glucosidase [Paenibacillus phyllosphaerae]
MNEGSSSWQEAIVYQIYPRSFKDSNGDGIGDLQGIISKLDYLKQLGVDVIWLSPIYRSPFDDNGYDISHYQEIAAEFGTMEDWCLLRDGLHARGMKLVMDLVINHTSDEHPWFEASRSSRDNPYRDFYYWRDGKPDGSEPNNWVSVFGGSAWEYDEGTQQYYLHLFSRKQPDLNWSNGKVRQSLYEMMRWWIALGIDGFRMDVINYISKAAAMPDGEVYDGARYVWGGQHFVSGPRFLEFLEEMNAEVLARGNGGPLLTVGEMPGVTVEQARLYTGDPRYGMNMVFQFEHVDIDGGGTDWFRTDWSPKALKAIFHRWQLGLADQGWNSLYLNNHDQPRAVSRFGDDQVHRRASATMLATMLHTLKGTPYIYQGEEIGMTNVAFPAITDYRDVASLNAYRAFVDGGGGDAGRMLEAIQRKSRDNARTPMQWNREENAGFTTGQPWIGVNPNYVDINAEQAVRDSDSIYHYYRRLITLRKQHPEVLVYGKYEAFADWHEHIYAYTREAASGERWLILLNMTAIDSWLALPEHLAHEHRDVMVSNYEVQPEWEIMELSLRPYEARVYRLR